MSTKVIIPIINNQLSAIFPDICVYCGRPKAAAVDIRVLQVDRSTKQKGQVITNAERTYDVKLPIPYCMACATRSEHYKKLIMQTTITCTIVGSLVGLIAFAFIDIDGLSTDTLGDKVFTFTLLVIGGGTTAGWFCWAIIPLFLKHFYSGLGVKANFTSDRKGIDIYFSNESFGYEFAQLNGFSSSSSKMWGRVDKKSEG